MNAKQCCKCGITFEGKDIYEHFLESYGGDSDRALKTASLYGWSESSKKKFVINRVMIKSLSAKPDHHECTNCGDKVVSRF